MAGFRSIRCTGCKQTSKRDYLTKKWVQMKEINGLYYCPDCFLKHKGLCKRILGAIHTSKLHQTIVVIQPKSFI